MKTKNGFALMIAFMLLLALTGCGLSAEQSEESGSSQSSSLPTSGEEPFQSEDTQPEGAPAEETQPQDAAPDESVPMDAEPGGVQGTYDSLLECYRTALEAQWEADQLAANDMSVLCLLDSDGDGLPNTGYAILDVTGDGVEELMIGSTDSDKTVFDLYTMKDGTVLHLCSSTEGSRYYLSPLEEGSTACGLTYYNTSDADHIAWVSYSITDGALEVSQAIKYDGAADTDNAWFMGYPEDGDVVYSPTAPELAAAIIEAAENGCYLPELTSFER